MCRPLSIPANRRSLGNWATMSFNGSTHSSTFNSQNQLVTNGPTSSTLAYDANGNTTTDENGNALHYDLWNRMTSWTDHLGSTTNTYSYDGLGRRYGVAFTGAAVADPAPDTAWVLSLAGQVLTEAFARSGTETVEYDEVWSPVYVNAMVCRDEWDQESVILSGHGGGGDGPSSRIYVRQDANYNVTSLVASSDGTTWTTVERDLYTPYGGRTVLTGSFGSRSSTSYDWTQGFQGGFADTGSGLVLFNSGGLGRYFNTGRGTWLRQDSLGYLSGPNRYAFVRSHPVDLVDPPGLSGQPPFFSPPGAPHNAGDFPLTSDQQIDNWANRQKAALEKEFAKLCPKGPTGSIAHCNCTPEGCKSQAKELADAIVDAIANHRKQNGEQPGGYAGDITPGVYGCGDWQVLMMQTINKILDKHIQDKDDCFNSIAMSAKSGAFQHQWVEVGLGSGGGPTIVIDPWTSGGQGDINDTTATSGYPTPKPTPYYPFPPTSTTMPSGPR